MAKVLDCGKPGTLVLSEADLVALDLAGDQAAALLALKAEHGLPAHAPVAADNGGEWLNGDAVVVKGNGRGHGRRMAGWRLMRRFPHGLRTMRHCVVG